MLAATGNSPDYYSYLEEVGAAGVSGGLSTIRDDVYAVTAYCPITDLGNADIAYEWLFNSTRKLGPYTGNGAGGVPSTVFMTWDELSSEEQAASEALAAEYPEYLASLGLALEDGTALTTDNIQSIVVKWLEDGFDKAIAAGIAVDPALWADRGVSIADGKASIVDFEQYKEYVAKETALKGVPAFDLPAGEQSLFGALDSVMSPFTSFVAGDAWTDVLATGVQEQLKLINPLLYIGTDADAAPYWYIRHGGRDRDTTWMVSVSLYYKLLTDDSIKDLNYQLVYDTPHSGDYDVPEAFAWIDSIL
jgi:hypothetical protein